MNILEAMAGERLFRPMFKPRLLRGDTWRAWRSYLAALFGLPLEGDALEIYRKHTGRDGAPAEPFRESFVVSGRRSGKSIIAAFVATFLACFRDYSDVLAPGETGVVMVIASDRRQARVILGYINGFFDSIPMLRKMVVNRLKESIELNNRIRIEIHTSSFRAVRGYTIVAAICDEIAFWPSDDSASPDTEVLNALRPAMATVPGALLLGISSAYAKRGVLFEMYENNFGKSDSPVLVWKATTREMNPTVSPLVIEAAYLRDPAAASAEYGSEFRSDIEGFIPIEVIRSCVMRDRHELPPVGGVTYAGFTDPSGGSSDSFTLAIAHQERGRAVLDLLREVPAPFSPETVVQEFADTLKRYRIFRVSGDRYAGEWPAEQFAKRGIQYRAAEKTRSELYLDLLPALTSGQCELLDHKRLIAQLASLERRTSRVGRDSVDHAPGGHDDCANAAAGALVEVAGGGVVLTWTNMVLEAQEKFGDSWREHLGDGAVVEPKRPLSAPALTEIMVNGKLTCPQCGSTCVVRRGPLYLCNSDGFEFAVPGARGVPFSLDGPPKGQRRDALAKERRR